MSYFEKDGASCSSSDKKRNFSHDVASGCSSSKDKRNNCLNVESGCSSSKGKRNYRRDVESDCSSSKAKLNYCHDVESDCSSSKDRRNYIHNVASSSSSSEDIGNLCLVCGEYLRDFVSIACHKCPPRKCRTCLQPFEDGYFYVFHECHKQETEKDSVKRTQKSQRGKKNSRAKTK